MRPGWMLFAALAMSGQGAAQTTESEDKSDIVVQGTRIGDRQIDEFIGALADTPPGGQLSRFEWAVCPAAVGLAERHNRAIAERMRKVAAAAGIPLAGRNCRPNALVIVARDKQEFIAALHSKYPAYFVNASGRPARPPRQPGAVTAWHVEGLLDSNGLQPKMNLVPKYLIVEANDSSRLNPASRPHFAAGIVVVELKALAGLTATQLADYAAMRIFARTDPARLGKTSAPTILSALDAPMGSAVPITLTAWDLGFLKAMYSSRENRFATQQRGEMKRILSDELKRPR